MLARLAPLVFLVSACAAVPGAPTEQDRAEAAWADLLALAAAPEAEAARFAPLIVSRGDDPARRWRAAADMARPEEARAVESAARELRALVARVSTGERSSYRVEGFRTETESEGTWRVLTVRFADPAGTRLEVAFLPIGGRLLLGDID